MAPTPWSITDEDRLRKLAHSGMGMAGIALQFGRNKSAVRVRAEKLNIRIARQQNPMQVGKRPKGTTTRI